MIAECYFCLIIVLVLDIWLKNQIHDKTNRCQSQTALVSTIWQLDLIYPSNRRHVASKVVLSSCLVYFISRMLLGAFLPNSHFSWVSIVMAFTWVLIFSVKLFLCSLTMSWMDCDCFCNTLSAIKVQPFPWVCHPFTQSFYFSLLPELPYSCLLCPDLQPLSLPPLPLSLHNVDPIDLIFLPLCLPMRCLLASKKWYVFSRSNLC